MEDMIENFMNPLRYSEEIRKIIFETTDRILKSGPEIWIGEKEKSPVSLNIPHEITEEIRIICKEKNLVQWDFETKLYTQLVLKGLTFIFLIRNSKVVDILMKEMKEKIEEAGLGFK